MMTKNQEVSRWYAEQMNLGQDEEGDYFITVETAVSAPRPDYHYYPDTVTFSINDPACQMAIEDWHCKLDEYNTVTHYHAETVIEKNRGDYISEHSGKTIKDALIALWEAMKDE